MSEVAAPMIASGRIPPLSSAAMSLASEPARTEFSAATTLDVVVRLFTKVAPRCAVP